MSIRLNEALIFAAQAHTGQTRKLSGDPYILHPMEAAVIVARAGASEDVMIAALLHDVVEDCGVSPIVIREKFGNRVADLVDAETENKRKDLSPEETWKVRKEESLAHLAASNDLDVKLLWLGDKLSNLRSLLRSYEQIGEDVWQGFHQKDKRQHEWYYKTVADLLRPYFGGTAMFVEYEQTLKILFGGATL